MKTEGMVLDIFGDELVLKVHSFFADKRMFINIMPYSRSLFFNSNQSFCRKHSFKYGLTNFLSGWLRESGLLILPKTILKHGVYASYALSFATFWSPRS